jgi:uncharacterized radical SAM superfamily Fe-S cluster-containing enzyme
METQTLLSSKKEVFSKFRRVFLFKNGQVFLIRKYGLVTYYILVENDQEFFKKSIKTWEECEYSSSQIPFLPTKADWECAKKITNSFTIHLTTKCNSKCNVCFVSDSLPYKDFSFNEVKEILSKIGKNKIVVITGGEPTVRKDLFKILKLIKKSGHMTALYTNGLKLTDPNYVKNLKKNGLDRVHLTFDGFSEEIHEKLRGNRKYLYLKLKALKNLERFDIEVYLSATIAAGINDKEVRKLLKFCVRNNHFIKMLQLYVATPFGRFNINTTKTLTPSDVIKLLEEASNGIVNRDYFLENKIFRVNMYHLLGKIGKFIPFGHHFAACPFYVNKNEISQLIPLQDLKNINKKMKRKEISIIKYISLKRLWWFIKFLFSRKFKPSIINNNILIIGVDIIYTPLNYIPIKLDIVTVQKFKDDTVMYANGN